MEMSEKPKKSRLYVVLIAAVMISVLIGGMFGYAISSLVASNEIGGLQNRVSVLEKTVSNIPATQDDTNLYLLGVNVSLSELYDKVNTSIARGIIHHDDIEGGIGLVEYR